MSEPDPDQLRKRWNRLQFAVQKSIRYHSRRTAFYDWMNSAINALSLVFGSAAVVFLLDDICSENSDLVVGASAALVAILNAVNLVVGSARMARDHTEFMRRFTHLERDMVTLGRLNANDEQVRRFRARRLEIEADEPPQNGVLDAICHNELMIARGKTDETQLLKIGRVQRFMATWFSLDLRSHRIQDGRTNSKSQPLQSEIEQIE